MSSFSGCVRLKRYLYLLAAECKRNVKTLSAAGICGRESATSGKVEHQPVQLARGNGSSAEIQNAPRLLGTKIIQRDLDVARALIEPCSPECREDQLSELTPISRSTWPAVPPACLRYRYT